MKKTPDIILRLLEDRMGAMTCQFSEIQLSSYRAQDSWRPPINAFRCRDGFVICADLAGVERSDIDVQVEPRRLWIRGRRLLAEPGEKAGPLEHVLAMEIDQGQFAREVIFPEDIDTRAVQAEQCNGLLWISLPLSSKG